MNFKTLNSSGDRVGVARALPTLQLERQSQCSKYSNITVTTPNRAVIRLQDAYQVVPNFYLLPLPLYNNSSYV